MWGIKFLRYAGWGLGLALWYLAVPSYAQVVSSCIQNPTAIWCYDGTTVKLQQAYSNATVTLPTTVSGGSGGGLCTPATNYYVASNGSDSNAGTTSGSPFLTIGHAVSLLPKQVVCGSITINIASDTFAEEVDIIGITAVSGATVTIQGFNNSTAHSFANGNPVLTGTSSGSNTNAFPAAANTLFKDATLSQFGAASTQQARWLHLTAGTGYDGSNDDNNWYPIETNTTSANLSIVGQWRGSTPDATTHYEIYVPSSATTITGSGARNFGINIVNSIGIIVRGIYSTNVLNACFNVTAQSQLNSGSSMHTSTSVTPVYTGRDFFLDACNSSSNSLSRGFRVEQATIGTMDTLMAVSDDGVGLYVVNSANIVNVLYGLFALNAHDDAMAIFNGAFVDRLEWVEGNQANIAGLDIENNAGVGYLIGARLTSNTLYGLLMAVNASMTLAGNLSNFNSNTSNNVQIASNSSLTNPSSLVATAASGSAFGVAVLTNGLCSNCGVFTLTGNSSGATNALSLPASIVFSGDHTGNPTATTGCGGSPSVAGTDMSFTVTIGSSPSGTCLVTYSVAFKVAPNPICVDLTTKVVEAITTPVVGSFTIGGTFAAADKVKCYALPEG